MNQQYHGQVLMSVGKIRSIYNNTELRTSPLAAKHPTFGCHAPIRNPIAIDDYVLGANLNA